LDDYLSTLFPNFDTENPFENPDYFKYPFKNISFDFFPLVRQMDERMELLEMADKEDMTYAEFVDYVLNHCFSTNDELGRDKYLFNIGSESRKPMFVRNTDLAMNKERKYPMFKVRLRKYIRKVPMRATQEDMRKYYEELDRVKNKKENET
jgi:hypothetical protein